ncbi:MAG: succinate dehydrogenase iron-sulfur subunit [Candidatus Brocadiia bacterium]
MQEAIFRIQRFDPEVDKAPRFQEYKLQCEKGTTVLTALYMLLDRQDGSLAFRSSCRAGICGSCAMHINGKYRLACETQVFALSQPITIQPLSNLPVIKDLIVDMSSFWKKYKYVQPYLQPGVPAPEKELPQTNDQRERLGNTIDCILCGACSASCPMSFTDTKYLGPAALLKAWRFVADSRDDSVETRLSLVDGLDGVWRCHTAFNCQTACPKDLDPTSGIAFLKREIMKRKFCGKKK